MNTAGISMTEPNSPDTKPRKVLLLCAFCQGKGYVKALSLVRECPSCKGEGVVRKQVQ